MAAMLFQEAQSLTHPCIQSGRTVLLNFADDMLAIAQPADVGDTLAQPKDFAAVFARQAGPQQSLNRRQGRDSHFGGRGRLRARVRGQLDDQ